ncbi:MAG: hypothetical protein O2955_15660 [Planctomycetota bacterium]|nr:hypothetical protein [Planctomycetota bacterium]MDA1213951.1 hypothetical protein [Planctomycetota bacterium]
MQNHGLRFDGTTFWVTHRRVEYGPFDYEWSKDFCGMELLYCRRKFGEYCSSEEFFADLKVYKLPMSVVRVASVVMGCIVFGVLQGWPEEEWRQYLKRRLSALGYFKFSENIA